MSLPNAWQSARRVRQKSGNEVHGLATVAADEKRIIETQPCAVDSVRAHCQRSMDDDQEVRIKSRGAQSRGERGALHKQTLASAPCVVLLVCSALSRTRTVEGRVGDHMKQGPLAHFPSLFSRFEWPFVDKEDQRSCDADTQTDSQCRLRHGPH